MSTWRQVLERAASVDPQAQRQLGPLVTLLEAVRAGRTGDARAEAVFSGDRMPFLDALDRAVRERRDTWDDQTVEAVRAALLTIGALRTDLDPARKRTARPATIQARLDQLEAQMTADQKPWPGAEVCPRCGARKAKIVTTKAVEPHYHELRCMACGYFEDWVGKRDRP